MARAVASYALILAATAAVSCFSDAPEVDETVGSTGSATSASDTGQETVTLSGTVTSTALTQQVPLEGVKVSVVGNASVSTVTDAMGNFVLEDVPANQPTFLAAAPSSQYLGTVVGVDVRFADIHGIPIGQLSALQVQTQIDAVQEIDPSLMLDESMALIGAVGDGIGAVIDLQPMPNTANVYGLDADGNAALGSTELAYWLFPVVVYFNVPPAAFGTYEVTVEHPMRTCSIDFPTPPTISNHITVVNVACT